MDALLSMGLARSLSRYSIHNWFYGISVIKYHKLFLSTRLSHSKTCSSCMSFISHIPSPPLVVFADSMTTPSQHFYWERGHPLQWRYNGCDSVSNHQPHDCLLSRLFRRRSKKSSKPRVTGHCAVNSPVTGEFPAQMASNAENVSIWGRHHVVERTGAKDCNGNMQAVIICLYFAA